MTASHLQRIEQYVAIEEAASDPSLLLNEPHGLILARLIEKLTLLALSLDSPVWDKIFSCPYPSYLASLDNLLAHLLTEDRVNDLFQVTSCALAHNRSPF